jgi:shikimate kinase
MEPAVPPIRLILVGMMGAGKTTVGRELARITRWPAVDNDELVRARTGRDAAAIAVEAGEHALHEAEAHALIDALGLSPPVIVGVAGAMVDRPEVREILRRAGHVVWLRARPATLLERIGSGAGRRPEATKAEWLRARAAERDLLYRDVADQVVDVDDATPAEIACAILDALGDGSAR